jgi:alkaline phosphatase D
MIGLFIALVFLPWQQHPMFAAQKIMNKPFRNLYLLNLWEKQPAGVEAVYKAAYRILRSKPEASFADLAEDAEFQGVCHEKKITHLGGPMLGSVSPGGVSVWLRTISPAKVEVRVLVEGTEKTFGPVWTSLETDLTAVVPIEGLKPKTHYQYKVLVDGKFIDIPESAVIFTAPEAAQTGRVRIVFGTCAHQIGLGNLKMAKLIRSRQPAALLLGGDIAVQDKRSHFGLHRADYLLRDFYPAWQSLCSAVPVYATWDDHDYYNNDVGGIPNGKTDVDRAGVWKVFRYAWNNPAYGFGNKGRGVFFRTRIGHCDIIMLDNRYFRHTRGDQYPFLGDLQMEWLFTQLLDCEGPFIILFCGTMWSDYVSNGKDSWGRWDPRGREKIFQFIEKNHIPGILLISGDRHGARGFRIPRSSGFNFYEFEVASLGGPPAYKYSGQPITKPGWKMQLFGFGGPYAFGEFTINAAIPDPVVTFRLIKEDAKVLYKINLKRSQLTPPDKKPASLE